MQRKNPSQLKKESCGLAEILKEGKTQRSMRNSRRAMHAAAWYSFEWSKRKDFIPRLAGFEIAVKKYSLQWKKPRTAIHTPKLFQIEYVQNDVSARNLNFSKNNRFNPRVRFNTRVRFFSCSGASFSNALYSNNGTRTFLSQPKPPTNKPALQPPDLTR